MSSLWATACLAPGAATADEFHVTDEGSLRQAILASNTNGRSNTITIDSPIINLTQSLPMITASVTINGGGNTIDAHMPAAPSSWRRHGEHLEPDGQPRQGPGRRRRALRVVAVCFAIAAKPPAYLEVLTGYGPQSA